MDKNMINIDDLIRQRLSSGEEEERAGAWLRMRELLDEKQPVRVAAVFNWKRMLSYAAGLVLLAVAGVAGYKATQSDAGDVSTVNRYSRNTNAMLAGAVSDNSNSAAGKENTDTENTLASTKHADTKQLISNATAAKQSGMVASTGKDAGMLATKHSNTTNAINTPAPVNAIKENQTPNKPSSGNTNNNSNNALAVNTNADNASVKANADVKALAGDNKPQGTGMNPVNVVAATKRNKTQQLPVEVTNPRYRKQIATIDSVEVITTKETGRKGIRKIDTIAQSVVATEKLVDAPAEVAVATTSATRKAPGEVLPSATLMERNSQHGINVALAADSKNDSKQSKNNYNPRRFEEMVQNMKVDFGKVSIHPGLVAGISSSVGAYNMTGLQLGIAGVMEISDRWGMFAELKGIYRFGNGKSLINDYKKVDPNNVEYSNNTYTYTWDSVAHSFNISSSTSIELPIAVRYSANRLSAFAGVNGVYNFAVKVDEYSQSYSRPYKTQTPSVQGLTQQWGENPVIGYDAFKARFMLGYVVGAGYQVTPNIGLDFRATQPLMESNAGTKSTAIVSKQLYRAPSFQLNFTYKFTNNKYKPREMNY